MVATFWVAWLATCLTCSLWVGPSLFLFWILVVNPIYSNEIVNCMVAISLVFASGFSGRLASDKRKSRENSCFSNSPEVKRVGKLQWNSH